MFVCYESGSIIEKRNKKEIAGDPLVPKPEGLRREMEEEYLRDA